MTDEERARWLARALDAAVDPESDGRVDAEMPPVLDDGFADLVRFGEALQRRAPYIAAMAQAREEFDPAFGTRLKEQLLAAHPAAFTARSALSASARPQPATSRTPTRLRWLVSGWRALGAVVVLAAAVLALLILSLQQSIMHPGLGTARPPATSTASSQGFPLFHPAIVHRATPPAIRSNASGATAGGVQPPVPAPHAPTPVASHNDGAGTAHAHEFSASALPTPGASAAPRTMSGPMMVAPKAPPSPRYVFPAQLPALPAVAPFYSLRYQALSPQAARAIAMQFPDLRQATGSSLPGHLRYAASGARLDLVLSTGAITYTARAGAPASARGTAPAPSATTALVPNSAGWRAAVAAARSWLGRHLLYPTNVDEPATQVFPAGDLTIVRFVPSLPGLPADVPIATQGSAPLLTVTLDGGDRVLSAYRLWPRIAKTGAQPLLTLTRAAPASPAAGAQQTGTAQLPAGATVFVINSVALVYSVAPAADGPGGAGTLRPSSYLLQGRLQTSSSPARPYSALLPTSAPPPDPVPTPTGGTS